MIVQANRSSMPNDKWQIANDEGDGLRLAMFQVCGKPHDIQMGDAGFRHSADILAFHGREPEPLW
jgi:hypothetical protein